MDLRSPDEVKERGDTIIPGIKYLNIPLTVDEETTMEINGLQLPDMWAYYRDFVSRKKKETWTKIFNLLLEDNEDGVIFHCSSGKDRTGTVFAVILSVLGFDKETIYKDYQVTNDNLLQFKKYAMTLPENVREIFLKHFAANPEYLDEVFKEINNLYGSIDTFFSECCSLDADKISALKRKYLNR